MIVEFLCCGEMIWERGKERRSRKTRCESYEKRYGAFILEFYEEYVKRLFVRNEEALLLVFIFYLLEYSYFLTTNDVDSRS